MSLFCLLWMPLFYLFWRSVTGHTAAAGGVWALLLGSVVALVQFFLGSMIEPGGFGVSRWVSGCIDIVTLPALLPFLVYILFAALKVIPGTLDFANFALLWLIPGAAIRAVSWSAQNDPTLLVLVPLLWTGIAVGVSFFIDLMINGRKWVIAPACIGILAVPFAAAFSWWAFYSQENLYGFLFLLAAALPALVSMIAALVRGRGA